MWPCSAVTRTFLQSSHEVKYNLITACHDVFNSTKIKQVQQVLPSNMWSLVPHVTLRFRAMPNVTMGLNLGIELACYMYSIDRQRLQNHIYKYLLTYFSQTTTYKTIVRWISSSQGKHIHSTAMYKLPKVWSPRLKMQQNIICLCDPQPITHNLQQECTACHSKCANCQEQHTS